MNASAQLAERPGTAADPSRGPKDLTGKSIKEKRVRAVHSTDSSAAGSSLYFQERDPWLAYQRGKNLVQRQFRDRDGVFGRSGAFMGLITGDKATPKVDRDHVSSCAFCHNVPYRDAGAGANMAKNGGEGRNTPHFYGGGLVEMIAQQTRQKLLDLCDAERRGFIPKTADPAFRVLIRPTPASEPIDYGACGDADGDGWPDLNNVFRVWYVDDQGRRTFTDANGDGAVDLRDASVAGYNFEMMIFGWGELTGAMAPTLRTFYSEPADTHAGMQAHDPTTNNDSGTGRDRLAFDGLAEVSNAGAQQFALHATPDRGVTLTAKGISRDDPDGDSVLHEISEGDLDLAEWFMLNAPAPAQLERTPAVIQGERLFRKWRCADCHVPDWQLQAGDPDHQDIYRRYDGDRRFFDLQTTWNTETGRLEGKLIPLTSRDGERQLPRRGAFTVRGVYSDFIHHDVGPDFYEVQFDGSQVTRFRTAPLWGVGSTAPYGHDGNSLTLNAVIRRHGGEASASARHYRLASSSERQALLAFLSSLQLYQTDTLPTDIDGDGKISEHFMIAGEDTGMERFNAEYLFNRPCRIEGPVAGPGDSPVTSYACVNVTEAYGEELAYIRDQDNDGFPDVNDDCPKVTGYLDGCRSALPPITEAPGPSEETPAMAMKPLPIRWVPDAGPDGATVNALMMDPIDANVIYMATDGGGMYKSTDAGRHWRAINEGLLATDPMAIAAHPGRTDTIYTTTAKGVFRSRDGGEHWSPVNEGLENLVTTDLAVHPHAPDIVFVGTHEGIYRSLDGGDHWERLTEGLPHHAHVKALILDAGRSTLPWLHQAPRDILYAGLWGGGIFRSIDGGQSWQAMNEGLADHDVFALARHPELPATLYAGTHGGGVYRSVDGGEHWTHFDSLPAANIWSVVVNPTRTALLHVGSSEGIFVSQDGGEHWARIHRLPGLQAIAALVTHPWNPGVLYVGTRAGAYRTDDGGIRWTALRDGVSHVIVRALTAPTRSAEAGLYAGTQSGLFARGSDGDWRRISVGTAFPIVPAIAFHPENEHIIYVGTEGGGILYTEDGGQRWRPLRKGLTHPNSFSVTALYCNPRPPHALYMATHGGLYKRDDPDKGWEQIGRNALPALILQVLGDPENPRILYAGSHEGIFASRDGGKRWVPLNNGLDELQVQALLVDPRRPEIVYAGMADGLYRSTDRGRHWDATGLTDVGGVISLAIDPTGSSPEGRLYAGTTRGLFASDDGGKSWRFAPASFALRTLVVDPPTRRLYAGTGGNGVWVGTLENP